MRPVIPELVWIGNALDLRDVTTALSSGVGAVIDLAANESPVLYPRDIAYCRLPLNDGAENEPAILRLAVSATAEFVKARVPALVACSAGMSRSPAVVAAALALVERRDPDDMLLRIAATGPHDVAPALWDNIKRVVFPRDERAGDASPDAQFALLVIKTNQLENVLAFYRSIGIGFSEERHGQGRLHYAGKIGPTVFELYPATEADSVDAATRLGFRVAILSETVDALRARGTLVASEPKSTSWGIRAVVRDPDGRAVELYQR